MVGQLNPGVWYWVLITMPRKQDGGDDGPGPEPIPLNSKLWRSFLSCNIDVGVLINDLITSGVKGAEYSSKSSTIVM